MPRIHVEQAGQGEWVIRKRVARLVRAAGLRGVSRCQRAHTAVRHADRRPVPAPVARDFTANAPNQLWVAEISML